MNKINVLASCATRGVRSVRFYRNITSRIQNKEKQVEEVNDYVWPRRIFSGIQPTGNLHLGNYLGAVKKWTELQNAKDDVTYCIVDMHSITMPQDVNSLRENIFQMAATMFACGIDPEKSTVFVQSAVREHAELGWILGCLATMARLSHLPQYKEKTRMVKEVPLGLFIYPVLQAADILLYKTTHVPVGEDQVQHIQLTQHLARTFNSRYGLTFPICHAIIDRQEASRIRSLRDPTRKMSKSDPDARATINITDDPDLILDKVRKAVTDFTSDVTFNPERRAGVSNLIAIHSLLTGQKIEQVVEEAKTIDTGKYKSRVADAIVEHLRPIRNKIEYHMARRNELIYLLDLGANKAAQQAAITMAEVKQKIGLGAQHMPAMADLKEEPRSMHDTKHKHHREEYKMTLNKPSVPRQELRIEKKMRMTVDIPIKKPEVAPKVEKPVVSAAPAPSPPQPSSPIPTVESLLKESAENAKPSMIQDTPSLVMPKDNAEDVVQTSPPKEVKI